jgi:hypothetical protein
VLYDGRLYPTATITWNLLGVAPSWLNEMLSTARTSGHALTPCLKQTTGPNTSTQFATSWPSRSFKRLRAPRDARGSTMREQAGRLPGLPVARAHRYQAQRLTDIPRVEDVLTHAGLPLPEVERRGAIGAVCPLGLVTRQRLGEAMWRVTVRWLAQPALAAMRSSTVPTRTDHTAFRMCRVRAGGDRHAERNRPTGPGK